MNYQKEFKDIIVAVSSALGQPIDLDEIEIIDRGVPHTPANLKPGTMGVYTFLYKDQFLKIGKAGPNSNPRFSSQHYNPGSSSSCLADSILEDPDMTVHNLTVKSVGKWIKQNCRRIDILIGAGLDIFTLELIESSLHYKYKPKYEGFSSQR